VVLPPPSKGLLEAIDEDLSAGGVSVERDHPPQRRNHRRNTRGLLRSCILAGQADAGHDPHHAAVLRVVDRNRDRLGNITVEPLDTSKAKWVKNRDTARFLYRMIPGYHRPALGIHR
jgi:hypothetical protein